MLENDVISATSEAAVLHDIEAGLGTHDPEPALQQGTMHRTDGVTVPTEQPANEPQDTQAMQTALSQTLTVPQDSASCLPLQHHIAQQQTNV